MEKYSIVRCSTCGHEKKGPRLVRLSKEHSKKWSAIQKKLNIHTHITVLGGLLGAVVVGVATALVSWHLTSTLWSDETRAFTSFGFAMLCYLFFAWIWFLVWEKRSKPLFQQRDAILEYYDIKKNPEGRNESYQVILSEEF